MMEHKAFTFDWARFETELLPTLLRALETNDPDPLFQLIDANRERLTDPYEGNPLPPDWQTQFDIEDVHNAGDFALTAYYDPAASPSGVGYEWLRLTDEYPEGITRHLLGTPIGPAGNRFNPSKYGSYFQRPDELPGTLRNLRAAVEPAFDPLLRLLDECISAKLGVYVTF